MASRRWIGVVSAVVAVASMSLGGCDKGDGGSAEGKGSAATAEVKAAPAPQASDAEQKAYLQHHGVAATHVATLPKQGRTDGAWTKTKATAIDLYRQRTVRLIDRDVNKALKTLGPRKAEVKALYDDNTLALQIRWADATMDQLQHGASDRFGDAIALEFPTKFGAGTSLPHVGMGDDRHSVVVTVARARKEKAYARQFVAAGFGSLTRIDRNTDMSIQYDEGAKAWSAEFRRPLKDHNVDLAKGLVPFALAIWDGHVRERGGNKSVSAWNVVAFDKHKRDDAYLKYLAWGEGGEAVGDAARGKRLMTPCTACHRVVGATNAPVGMAPGLDNIGGYGTAQYLRESIVRPNDIVVRQLNVNRHYDKKGKRDSRRSFPSNHSYRWYVGGHGKPRTSKMPSFAHMPEEDVRDIVAYLKTLKTPPIVGGAAAAPAAATAVGAGDKGSVQGGRP